MRSMLTRSDFEIAMRHHPMLRTISMIAHALEWPRVMQVAGLGGEATRGQPYDATLTVHERGFTFHGQWRTEHASIRFHVEASSLGFDGGKEIIAEVNVAASGGMKPQQAVLFAAEVETAVRRVTAADVLLRATFTDMAQEDMASQARRGFDAWKAIAELAKESGD